MTEKIQARRVQSRQAVFVRCCLKHNVSGLHFEASDNEGDMENNTILWFAADDEENYSDEIRNVLNSLISTKSKIKYTVSIVDDFS